MVLVALVVLKKSGIRLLGKGKPVKKGMKKNQPGCKANGFPCDAGITDCCSSICHKKKCASSRRCYSGDMFVLRADGSPCRIADVKEGDRLYAVDSTQQRLIQDTVNLVSHSEPEVPATFVRIETDDGGYLELTQDHFVCLRKSETKNHLVPARSVCLGDTMLRIGDLGLVETRVVAVTPIDKKGVFNFYMTHTPFLYVNGFVSSPVCDTIGLKVSTVPMELVNSLVPSFVFAKKTLRAIGVSA